MSNCFYSGNPVTLEDLLEDNPSLGRYYQGLPPQIQHTLEEHRTVLQSPAAVASYASKLLKEEAQSQGKSKQ